MKRTWVYLGNATMCLYRATLEKVITPQQFSELKHRLDKQTKQYTDAEMVKYLTETSPSLLEKNRGTSIKVSFQNNGRFSEKDIGGPILENGNDGPNVIGRITDVKPEYFFAEIFARYAQKFIKTYQYCDKIKIETEEEK